MKTVFLSKKQTFLKVCVLTTLCLLIFSAHSDIQAAMKGKPICFQGRSANWAGKCLVGCLKLRFLCNSHKRDGCKGIVCRY
jgi:hypothetical protein